MINVEILLVNRICWRNHSGSLRHFSILEPKVRAGKNSTFLFLSKFRKTYFWWSKSLSIYLGTHPLQNVITISALYHLDRSKNVTFHAILLCSCWQFLRRLSTAPLVANSDPTTPLEVLLNQLKKQVLPNLTINVEKINFRK